MIQIESNISMPTAVRVKYPWHTMNVGDSFLSPTPFETTRVAAAVASKRYGKHFTARPTPHGPRVWRAK